MSPPLTHRFASLPTAAKLLLILSAALLPIGIALMWIANSGIRQANDALRGQTHEQARAVARSFESLIARNALALRIAANGALSTPGGDPCGRAQRSLSIAPGVGQEFELRNSEGQLVCEIGRVNAPESLAQVAPGAIQLIVAQDRSGVIFRVGVIGGMATGRVSATEFQAAARDPGLAIDDLFITDGEDRVGVISQRRPPTEARQAVSKWTIGNGALSVNIATPLPAITTVDRLLLLLPLLMWIMAALVTWLLVSRLLIRPLKILERAVIRLQPGDGPQTLPRKLGPATEIQQLRDAFARGLERIEQSEQEMAAALEGQRRLVREVHHRVKNNLQVVASLLNIHGRTAPNAEARAAYAAIGRRVGALSIVHRNHYAEMEEKRGISLRPLLAELSAELRAGAPDTARSLAIELDVDSIYTTQDVAVSVAFLITEIVEFAMFHRPDEPVEVSLHRTSELTARLTLGSPVLVPDDTDAPEKVQFERIIGGLAKQLRSPLERKLGRYSVDLPVFPPN